MARALADIITEISSSYNPMRERANALYNKQFSELAPQETADLSGLEQAKQNAFESISTGANRRGMFYSGVPIAEQSKYIGENYLPSIASLKNRYAGIRGNLYQTLAQTLGSYDTEANSRANDIYQQELARDEQIRQFNETLAAQERAAAASRASGGGGGGSGNGAFTPSLNLSKTTAKTGATPAVLGAQTKNYIGNNDFRGRLAYEASQGDTDAKVMLKYVGNDNRYDGAVPSLAELDVLRRNGVQGNYYVAGLQTTGSVNGLEYR